MKIKYASLSRRFFAQIIDLSILSFIYIFIDWKYYIDLGEVLLPFINFFPLIILFTTVFIALLIWLIYLLFLEAKFGISLGKKILKIKVIRENGYQCNLTSAFIRNILRIIDFLPLFYIIGISLIVNSNKRQRFGDKMAGTVVISTIR